MTSTPARPTLVLLPGTLCDARLFRRTACVLRGSARVILPSLHNLRRPVGAWAERLLRRLPPRFVLGGFSLGGLLALELLRRAPHRVEGLAMMASNADAGSRAGARRSRRLWRDWRTHGAGAVARSLKPRYFHHDRQRQRHAALVRDMALATPAAAARAQFAWAAERPSGLDALAASNVPLLVLSGANDPLCTRAMQQRMLRARPDSRWIELPRCGHFLPIEASSTSSRLLQQWLGGLERFRPSAGPADKFLARADTGATS